jgi:hypothetical protein
METLFGVEVDGQALVDHFVHQEGAGLVWGYPHSGSGGISGDITICLWDPRRADGAPRVIFVADAANNALGLVPSQQLLLAGDASGRLHWLEMGGHQP